MISNKHSYDLKVSLILNSQGSWATSRAQMSSGSLGTTRASLSVRGEMVTLRFNYYEI